MNSMIKNQFKPENGVTVHEYVVFVWQISSWDLESGEIFAVLNWVLHVYDG